MNDIAFSKFLFALITNNAHSSMFYSFYINLLLHTYGDKIIKHVK